MMIEEQRTDTALPLYLITDPTKHPKTLSCSTEIITNTIVDHTASNKATLTLPKDNATFTVMTYNIAGLSPVRKVKKRPFNESRPIYYLL